MNGILYVVATPIGNLEDITVRALRVLREVTIIAAEDTRRTAHLLARHAIATRTTSLHAHNERRKAPALVERLLAGQNIALVSDAGTPTISDPGHALVAAAITAGIRVEPIPGPSAILAALTASGVRFDSFSFLGFPPIRSKDRKNWLNRLRSLTGTVVFFEAPHRIERTLRDLMAAIGDQHVVVGRELTKIHEELVRGPISEILSNRLKKQGELTIVLNIGHITDMTPDASPELLARELGELTNSGAFSRRQAVNELARRHRMAPNAIYAAVEHGKKSVDRPT